MNDTGKRKDAGIVNAAGIMNGEGKMNGTDKKGLEFEEIAPESVGIPSEAVLNFIRELDRDGFCMHGFLLAKAGKVFAEGYYAPFDADTPHRMYSVGKSFTSVAVGLLQAEGKLSISDRICSYFPDKLPKEGVHPYIEETTIRHLLCMATPHSYTTYKQVQEEDWVKTFFTVKPVRRPGTSFAYDTSSTHVLSALVERLCGRSLLEYLRVKVLDPIGCSDKISWLKCPLGICQGGSGLICTLRDLAKFAYTCMNGGSYEGKQLIPEEYIKAATSKQINTCLQPCTEEQQGYGYQFWRCRNDGFALYGMGGQLAVCLPKADFMMVTQADNLANPNGVQGIYDALWHCIFPYLERNGTSPLPQNSGVRIEVMERTAKLRIKSEKGRMDSAVVPYLNGKEFYMDTNPMGISRISLTVQPKEGKGTFHFVNELGENRIQFGLGRMEKQKFPGTNYNCISSAAWIEENVLHLRTYIIDECYASVNMTITILKGAVTLAMKKTAETFLCRYEGAVSGTLLTDSDLRQ